MFCLQASYFLFVYLFQHVSSTEISVSINETGRYHDLKIDFPVLRCHVRHTGYKEVSWYKDKILLKKGSAKLSDHYLPLKSLLNGTFSSVHFEHPMKLQGYYWCQTELTNLSTIFDYLYHIKDIRTFVGKVISRKDSLGENEDITLKEKKKEKKHIYEIEMQDMLFSFLPKSRVYVTDINLSDKGLEVRFFLYVHTVIDQRRPVDNELILDQHELEYILEYVNNETSSVDPEYSYAAADWAEFRGIRVKDMKLRSTKGCYEEKVLISEDPLDTAMWLYARIGDIVLLDNACLAKNGLPVTRMCTGSFNFGATWGNPSGVCHKQPEETAKHIRDLYDEFGTLTIPQYIEAMNSLMDQPSTLDVTSLHIATEILKVLSAQPNLNQKEVTGILSVISKMVEANSTELNAAKTIVRLTSRILQVLDNILEQASKEEKEIRISQKHLLVDTKYTKSSQDEHILGFAVTSPNEDLSLENGSIEFVLSSTKKPLHDSIAYFVLPSDLISTRESKLTFPCQVSMIFFKEWYLFQNPKDVLLKRNYKVSPTPVIYASISGGPAYNLTDQVQLYFKDTLKEKVENPVCVYYDARLRGGVGAWSSEGCEYKGLKNGFHNCRCNHLSIFAVILSQRPDTAAKFKLGTPVYIACGFSILALSLAVLLFILSKHWRVTIDHSILFCLSLTFLVCLILIFISELHFKTPSSCMILALAFHYTIFAILGWLLVHAVVYKLRFTKKTDLSEIPHFMIKAALSVWGSPIIILLIIWLSKDYSPPGKDNCWITVSQVSLVSVIPVVVLMLVILCVNSCATYSLTCRFRKDFVVGDSHYQEPAVKFRVAFTIFIFFVLTWLFGFFALHKRSHELRLLFSITVTLTAYYVTLFFIFHEISFWELCTKWKKKEDADSLEERAPAVKYEAKSYQTLNDEFPKENLK